MALTFLVILSGIWKWKIILRSQGEDLSFRDIIPAYLGNFSLTYLAPTIFFAGETFRSYFIKQKNPSLTWQRTISSIFLDRILDFSIMIIFVLAGVLYFLFNVGLPPKNLCFILGGILFILFFGVAFFYLKCLKKESIIKLVLKIAGINGLKDGHMALEVEKEIFEFFHKRMYFGEILFLAILRNVLLWFRHGLLIYFLGGGIGLLGSLSVLGFTYLVSLVPIPALLGSHEIVQAFIFHSFGMARNMGTVFTMLLRSADLIVSLLGVVILCRFGYKFIKIKLGDNYN